MSRVTDTENEHYATLMLQESWGEERDREEAHRALPESEQPPMVVCFGALDYRVIWVAPFGGEDGLALANQELGYWEQIAERGGLRVRPLHSNTLPHEFQVRTQASLDELTEAIQSTYRFQESPRAYNSL